ncbi:MAG: hypothetical protein JRH10_23100 [Deltaproteobacteria bacterium]|nr:hypothetical protein [Deltaproteobacteria bacterium]
MRRLLLTLVLVLAAVGFFLWRSMMPPSPLAVPPQGATFESVTVVQPGEGRFAKQRVVIEGGRIAEA